MSDRPRNERGRFTPTPPLDIQEESQIPELEAAIQNGPATMILVHADWCGHCQTYKPSWSELENTPGRVANIARVKDTVFPKIPSIAKAKIQGYPSVVVLSPRGEIEQFPVEGSPAEVTNAVPYMRDMEKMKKELRQPSAHKKHRAKPKTVLNRVVNSVRKTVFRPLQKATNSLFGAKSYKSPKKILGGTRRNRRGRSTRRHSRRA